MISFCIALLLLQVPAASTPASQSEVAARALVYAPKPGTKLARTITIAQSIDEVGLAQGAATGEMQRGPGYMKVDTRLELEFDDEVLAVKDGRAEKLDRMFRAGRFHAEFGPKGEGARRAKHVVRTPLEGLRVLYTWTPSESSHGRLYPEKEGMEEFLAGLTEDADLRALLPTKPVRPADTWSLAPDGLVHVFAPSGRLPWSWPKDLDRAMVRSLSTGLGGGLGELFGGTARGKVDATLLRFETKEGTELAIVKLALDLDLDREQGDFAPESSALEEGAATPAGPSSRTRWTLTGAGELAWDLRANHARSLRLSGTQRIVSTITIGSTRQELELTGTLELQYGVR